MIKKKLNILLLLLLVLLFTSLLGTTSYARELNDNDIKNFIYNYCVFYGYTEEQAESYVTAFSNLPNANDNTQLEIDRWKNIANNLYPGQYILWGLNNRIGIWRYGSSDTNMRLYAPYYYKSYDTYYIGTNTSYLNSWNTVYDMYNPNNITITYTQGSTTITLGQNESQFFFYTDTNVYTNSTIANGTIKYSAETSIPSNVFSGSYTDDYFIYAPSSLIDEIDLNGSYYFSDTAQVINFVRDMEGNVNEADAVIPGYISLAKNFDYANFDSWSYNVTTGMYEATGEHWTQTTLGTIESDIIDVTFSALNWGTLYKADTIIHAEFVPKSNEFQNQHAYYYIYSQYTQVNNGVLDTKNTFSGDYALIVNSNNNTDKIINNDNSLYDKMFKISGDKIDNIFQEAMEKIEIESGELAEYEIIKRYLEGEPRRFYNIVGFIYAKAHDKREYRGIWRW